MFGIILAIGYTIFFFLLIRKLEFFKIKSISRGAISFVFILKIIAGTLLWCVYTRLYTDRLSADIFKYFDDGKVMYNVLFANPQDYFKMLLGIPDVSLQHYYLEDMRHWVRPFNQGLYNENRTLIRFNALVDIFSFGNYHVHTVVMCLLSLTGLTGIYKTFFSYLPDKKNELFAIVFLFPSVIFWGSGVLKEGLILFAMGMLIYHWHKSVTEKFSTGAAICILLFAGLLSVTKIYMLIILFPSFIACTWIIKTKYKMPGMKFLVVLITFLFIVMYLPRVLGVDISFMLMEKQRQTINIAQGGSYLGNEEMNRFVYIKPEIPNRIIRLENKPGYCKIVPGIQFMSWNLKTNMDTIYVKYSSDTATYWVYYDQPMAGSTIKIPVLDGTLFSIIKNAPFAFFNTAFRPYIFEIKNPLMFLSGIENFFVMLFIFLCILFASIDRKNIHLLYFCTTIAVLLFVLIGLTTPILGAVARYKVPALPFFLIIFLLLLDKEKLRHRFPVLKKFI